MKLFSKSLDTKRDHLAELKSALSAAINTALKAGVLPGLIRYELESQAGDFRRAEEFRLEQRRANPLPQMFDALTLEPIDAHGEARRAEERRTKAELARQQKEYRDSVNERGLAEARRRGEIL